MPPWPTLFSTTQGAPRCGCSQSQKMRAMLSFGPPARKPTTNLIGRAGNFSAAKAGNEPQTVPSSRTAKRTARMTHLPLAGRGYLRPGGGKSEPAFRDFDGVAGAERMAQWQHGADGRALELAGDGDRVLGGARREAAGDGDGILHRHVRHIGVL